jgi:hypothetical protein
MDKLLINRVDVLIMNYITLKGLTNEMISNENPIMKYYVNKLANTVFNTKIEELDDEKYQKILEQSYILYKDLNNLKLNVDPAVKPILESMGVPMDSDKLDILIDVLKKEFKSNFYYLIEHTNFIINEKINHIKIKILTERMQEFVDKEDYLEAASIRDQIKEIKKES